MSNFEEMFTSATSLFLHRGAHTVSKINNQNHVQTREGEQSFRILVEQTFVGIGLAKLLLWGLPGTMSRPSVEEYYVSTNYAVSLTLTKTNACLQRKLPGSEDATRKLQEKCRTAINSSFVFSSEPSESITATFWKP